MTESRYLDPEDEAFNEIERQAKQRKESVKAAITKGKTMNNPSAFPKLPITRASNGEILYQSDGMTLRDYFAAKAMLRTSVGSSYEQLAKTAYEIADAMLKAREA
jgi:hypothetical protein